MSSSRLNASDQEKLMRSLTKALSEEGVKKKLNAPSNTPTRSEKPKQNIQGPNAGRRISTPPIKGQMVRRPILAGQSQEVPIRNTQKRGSLTRVTSVPRPSASSQTLFTLSNPNSSVSPRKQPPAPPPRIKNSNPDLSNLPSSEQLQVNLQTSPQQTEQTTVTTIGTPTPPPQEELTSNSEPILFPIAMGQSRSMIMNPDNESDDPEEFYRSVRKLTQYPIAASDRGSIRVLQLEGMDGVAWSRFESIFEGAGENEPEELSDLFDLHKYDYEVCTRKRIVDKEHQQFLVSNFHPDFL